VGYQGLLKSCSAPRCGTPNSSTGDIRNRDTWFQRRYQAIMVEADEYLNELDAVPVLKRDVGLPFLLKTLRTAMNYHFKPNNL